MERDQKNDRFPRGAYNCREVFLDVVCVCVGERERERELAMVVFSVL